MPNPSRGSGLVRAALSATWLTATLFVAAPGAYADHATCEGTTHEMGKAAAGVVGGAAGQYDVWTSTSYFTTRTFTAKTYGDGYSVGFLIYTPGCAGNPICSSMQVAPDTNTCTINYAGEVVIALAYADPNDGRQVSYVLTTDAPPATCVEGVPNVVACVGATSDLQHVTVIPGTPQGGGSAVVGTLDIYRIPVASVTLTVPCVVLTVGAQTVNPCAAAGGTYVSTLATLVNTTAPGIGTDAVTIGICNGRLTATVLGIGVESAPVVVPC